MQILNSGPRINKERVKYEKNSIDYVAGGYRGDGYGLCK